MFRSRAGRVLFCAILAIFLAGCGHLRSPVVVDRDLTPAEYDLYSRRANASRVIYPFPLFGWGKLLSKIDGGEILADKFFLFPGFPSYLPGVRRVRGALFGREGRKTGDFGLHAFEPLYTHYYSKVKEDGDTWRTELSFTRIVGYFGWGQCRGRTVVKFIVHFGATRSDIYETNPHFRVFKGRWPAFIGL